MNLTAYNSRTTMYSLEALLTKNATQVHQYLQTSFHYSYKTKKPPAPLVCTIFPQLYEALSNDQFSYTLRSCFSIRMFICISTYHVRETVQGTFTTKTSIFRYSTPQK